MLLFNTKNLSGLMVICLSSTAYSQSSTIPVLARAKPTPIASNKPIDIVPADTKALIDLLQACDTTLEKCKASNADKGVIIEEQGKVIDSSLGRVRDLEKSQDSFWNSKLLWFSVGALFTGVVVNLVKK